MALCGGTTAASQPTEDDLRILMPVIEKYLEEKCGQRPSDVKITDVSRQIVAGVNYFAKHDGNVWHIRVHQQLPCNGGLVSVHSHKIRPLKHALSFSESGDLFRDKNSL
ncbi:unnamed protein product [Rodentolepis nana]|uniref:Cystatin domain-containing protein n=1 Tax=Rodentolepis nana TaxID=102285 RepID=A0A0R3T9U9_RODNA|nr:unnamed protein product [Rodentolepis nana]